MKVFLKVVATAAAVVGLLALWERLPLRAALLLMVAAMVWSAQRRTLQRPGVMVAAAVLVLLALIANFVGPYSLGLFDSAAVRR